MEESYFTKREKDPWRSVTLLKVTLLHGCFSRFLNCRIGTKSRNASHVFVTAWKAIDICCKNV